MPGKGLTEHPLLYAGEWDTRNNLQTMKVVRGGKVVWRYGFPIRDSNNVIQELGDASTLKNGNIVFSTKTTVAEITADKKIMWSYTAPKGSEIPTAQPIGKTRLLIMQNGNPVKPELMIFNTKTNMIEKECSCKFPLISVCGDTHFQPNPINGNFTRTNFLVGGEGQPVKTPGNLAL